MVVYKCRVCGLPKKGHICMGAPTNASSSGPCHVVQGQVDGENVLCREQKLHGA